jgi:hypothetical protein
MDKYPNDQPETELSTKSRHPGTWVAIILIVVAIGAFGVLAYLHRPTTGIVTRVSATNITIRPSGSSTTMTYIITKTTQMVLAQSSSSNMQPQLFDASDIHTGETIIVTAPSNHQAQAIVVKPQ